MSQSKWTQDQQKVIDLRECNILVSAAAGSGKTAVLVERIIQMIVDEKHPVDIDRLLVVTFTKAAAAEMRSRIGDAIEARLLESPDNEHLQRQATLLHNAQITTIDSFCQNIIRNYFHVIDIDPVFRVADENDLAIMKTEVLCDLIEQKYIENSGKTDSPFLQFTDIFSPGRTDSNIEDLVLRMFNISMSYPWPVEWLTSCGNMYKSDSVESMENTRWMKQLVAYAHEMVGNYLNAARRALSICNESDGPINYSDAVASDINQIEMIYAAETYADMYDAFGKLNTARLSAKRDPSVSADKKEKVKAMREMYMKNGIADLKKNFFYQSTQDMFDDISQMSVPVGELISLTISFIQAFAQKKREEGVLDFGDMEHFALDILVDKDGEDIKPSQVALELQDYYEEILTDEYQDSNFVQELLLKSLSRSPEQKPYLFMVGDVKQSIYQFRLARPELFMEKYDTYTIDEGKNRRIDLHQNFRSRSSVLNGANAIFEQIMHKSVGGINYDEAASLVPGRKYEECEYRTAEKTKVMVIEQKSENDEPIEKRALEAAAIGNEIRSMVQGDDPLYVCGRNGYHRVEYRDIVILLRSISGWSEEFIETLTDMGIPAYSDTKTGYFGTIEVSTILNLLKVIDNPRQDIPLVAVLRSVIVGLTDEEMANIGILPRTLNYMDAITLLIKASEDKEGMSDYWDRLVMPEEDKDSLVVKIKGFMKKIKIYHDMSQNVSVYELIQYIYKDTGYYDIMSAMPAGEKRAANLDILSQQSIEFAENGHQGLFGFTNYIEHLNKSNIDFGEASVVGENTNAVRIMSIHKSKGLQFPVVFVSGMGKAFNLQDARKSTIIDPDYGVGADCVDLTLRTKRSTLIKKFMMNEIKRNTLAEEIRILYVALTRAEEKLILTGTAAGISKKMERWSSRAENMDMSTLLGAQTYLDWIVPAVLNSRSDLFDMIFIDQEDIVADEKSELEENMEQYNILKNWNQDRLYDERMHQVIEEIQTYQYPYANEQQLPVKVSVSELKRLAMQKADEMAEGDEFYVAPKPKFMKQEKKTSGAARGTLYHLVMEHMPYDRMDEAFDFESMIDDMVKSGYMTEEEADILDIRKFQSFAGSSIGERIRKAACAGKLKREQPFMLAMKAEDIYTELTGNKEIVMIQGIIDAFFYEGDDIILVDYKTDSVRKGHGQELADKYVAQLDYYAKALHNLTGHKVAEKIIYSFALGEEIIL